MGTPVMTSMNGYSKLFMIPQNKHDKEILLSVDRKTRLEVEEKYGIIVDYDWQCNTVANAMVETIIKFIAYMMKSNPENGIGIDFYNVFRSIVSYKKNEKAEKEGNINIFFEPGSKVNDIIEKGPDAAEDPNIQHSIADYISSDEKENELYRTLDTQCKYQLTMHNSIMFPDHVKFFTSAITCTFLMNIFKELLYRAVNDPDRDKSEYLESVNFNDLIEIHALIKDGHASINMRPGVNAKLLIKCDELTESTLGDFQD